MDTKYYPLYLWIDSPQIFGSVGNAGEGGETNVDKAYYVYTHKCSDLMNHPVRFELNLDFDLALTTMLASTLYGPHRSRLFNT